MLSPELSRTITNMRAEAVAQTQVYTSEQIELDFRQLLRDLTEKIIPKFVEQDLAVQYEHAWDLAAPILKSRSWRVETYKSGHAEVLDEHGVPMAEFAPLPKGRAPVVRALMWVLEQA